MCRRLALVLSLAAAALAASAASNRIQFSYCFDPGEAAGGGVLNTERHRIYCVSGGSQSFDSGSVSDAVGDECIVYSLPPAGMKVEYWLAGSQLNVYNDVESVRVAAGASEYHVQYSSKYSSTNPVYVGARFCYISYGVVFAANGGSGSMSALSGRLYTDTFALPANAFAKTGYTFSNWRDSAGNTFTDRQTVEGSDFDIVDDGTNVTLTAQWVANTYTAFFNANGGTVSTTSKKVTYDSVYGTLPTPVRNGYAFAGWVNAGSTITADTVVKKAQNHTLYAKWVANTYTVALDMQGGSGGTESVTTTYGQMPPAVTPPTRTGYTFGGYFTSKNGGGGQYYNEDGTGKAIWNNTKTYKLYAKWTANKYTVALDMQGGSGGTAAITATYGQLPPTITVPTRTGYTFGGYFTSKNGGGGQYYNADGTPKAAWNNSKTYTLYAKWTANTYDVALDKQGGSGGTAAITATYGQTPQNVVVPARTGYTFGGYFTSKGGGGGQYYNADGTPKAVWNNTRTYTLYAKWTVNTYDVTLDKQGGSGGTESITATYGQTPQSIEVPTLTGYTFGGYWTSPNGGGGQYYNADGTPTHVWNNTRTYTLYAKWTVNTYNVMLDPQGGSGGATNVFATYGQMPPAVEVPTRGGDIFDGYWTAPNGGGGQYFGADGTPTRTWNNTKTYTLYAKWIGTYNVTLDKQGGSGGTSEMTVSYGQLPPVIEPPTRTGYTFGGYFTSKDGGGGQYYNADGTPTRTWNNTKTYTLYAKWTANTYNVALDMQGGSGGTTNVIATYGRMPQAVTVPTRTGYTFDGYWTKVNGVLSGQYYDDVGEPTHVWNNTKTYTLYAKWIANTYEVTLDMQGGSGGTTNVTATYEQLLPGITPPTLTGYTFGGYFMMAGGVGEQYYDASGAATAEWNHTESCTLYAKWTVNTYEVSFNKGAGSGEMENQIFTYGIAQNLADCEFAPPPGSSFWMFSGWSNIAANVFYTPNESVSNLTAVAGGIVELTAVWEDGRTELSKAMHCTNLIWKSDRPVASGMVYWGAAYAAKIGLDSDSCVTNIESSQAYLYASVPTNGTLTFYARCDVGEAILRCSQSVNVDVEYSATNVSVTANDDWQLVSIDIAKFGSPWNVVLKYNMGSSTIYIDQMTWTPEGADKAKTKPSKKDARDISSVSFSSGRLALTFTNADERFDYQLRGTNDPSVARSLWPVLLTTNGVGTIMVEPPVDSEGRQMFYYLQTIGK